MANTRIPVSEWHENSSLITMLIFLCFFLSVEHPMVNEAFGTDEEDPATMGVQGPSYSNEFGRSIPTPVQIRSIINENRQANEISDTILSGECDKI